MTLPGSAETRIWLLLVLLTAGSFVYGVEAATPTQTSGHLILGVALLKAWLVGRYFMELRRAPPLFRRIADAWLLLTATLIYGLRLLA